MCHCANFSVVVIFVRVLKNDVAIHIVKSAAHGQ